MNADLLRSEFEKLARRLDIEIRYTDSGPSGLCTIRGRRVLFIDRGLDTEAKLVVFAREFRALDLEGIYVVPAIRRLLGMEGDNDTWLDD